MEDGMISDHFGIPEYFCFIVSFNATVQQHLTYLIEFKQRINQNISKVIWPLIS